MTVTYEEFLEDKKAFFKKHNHDYQLQTSQMDKHGSYIKAYVFKDGAIWMEEMSPERVKRDVEVKKVNVTVEVKLLKTEYWNSEAGSKYYYEKV